MWASRVIREGYKAPHDAFLVFLNFLLLCSIIYSVYSCRARVPEKSLQVQPNLQYNGEYCVLPFVRRSQFKSAAEIFLVLHATIDNVDESMMQQFSTWMGAIVLNVLVDAFYPEVDPQFYTDFQIRAINKINRLLYKHEIYNIDVHFTFQIPIEEREMSCADYLVRPKYVLDQKDDANLEEFAESPMLTEDNWYPINVLRNSARLFVPKHRLMTLSDAQFMFSFNFDESVSQNVESGLIDLRRDLLVYRIFEGYPDEELGYPLSKQELRGSIDAQQTRLFHEEAAPESHWIPDMKTWLGTTTLNGTVKYRYSDAAWEPQFVAQNTIPFHDEAFPYLIRDNANQRWELCRAGYRFKVLNGAFAIHPGFKSKEDAQSDQDDRTVVLARYAKAVHNFNNWMDLRYPKTTNKCPRMKADDKSRRAYEDRQMLELYSSAERKLRVEQMRHEKEEEQKRAEDDRKWQINVEILRAIKMQENPGKLPEPLANEEANNYE